MPDEKIAITSPFHSTADNSRMIRVPALGLDLTVRLAPDVLGGAMTVFETTNASGFGPPLHRHREAEVFRVLEGVYLYELDGRRFQANVGDVVCVPGGAVHAFRNISDRSSRQLVMMLPGMDAERFFLELADVLAKPHADRSTLNTFGAPWGVEFLGPPLAP